MLRRDQLTTPTIPFPIAEGASLGPSGVDSKLLAPTVRLERSAASKLKAVSSGFAARYAGCWGQVLKIADREEGASGRCLVRCNHTTCPGAGLPPQVENDRNSLRLSSGPLPANSVDATL